jgi:hypothetical protein
MYHTLLHVNMRKNRQKQIETQGELVSYNEGQGTCNRTELQLPPILLARRQNNLCLD